MTLARKFAVSSVFRTLEALIEVGIGLVLMPFLLGRLGAQDYGLWIIITSVVGAFYLFDLGFGTSTTRFIADGLGRRDPVATNRVVSSALAVYTLLGVVVLAATLTAIAVVPIFVANELQIGTARLVLFLTGLALAIEFPFKSLAGIASFHMRYDLGAIARTVVRLIAFALVVVAVRTGYSIVTIAVIGLFASIVLNLCFAAIARHLEPSVYPSFRSLDLALIRELASFSSWTFSSDVFRILRTRGDVWLVGFSLGSSVLATYYVAIRLVEGVSMLLNNSLGMTTALFSRAIAEGGVNELRRKVQIFCAFYFFVAAYVIGGFVVFSSPVFDLWMKGKVDTATCVAIAIISVTGQMASFVSAPYSSALIALKSPRLLALTSLIEAVLALGIAAALVLGLKRGMTGAAFGMMLGAVVARLVILPTLALPMIELTLRDHWMKIWRPLAAIGPIVLITWLFTSHFPATGIFYLLAGTAAYSLLCGLASTLVMTTAEVKLTQQLLPSWACQPFLAFRRALLGAS